MNRISVYACYSKNGKVEEYVFFFLQELKKVSDIVIVYDNPIDEKSRERLQGYTIHGIYKKHNMYDFGSYKIGIEWLVENDLLEKYDSLILCNDSVFGPFSPLETYFNIMENKENIDFWGLLKHKYNRKLAKYLNIKDFEHIQSYFIIFNKSILSDSAFFDFFSNVTKQSSNIEVIKKYEIGLSQFLYKKGYKSDGIFVTNKDHLYSENNTLKRIKQGFPFLKKKFFTMSPKFYSFYQKNYIKIKETIYPYNMKLIDSVVIDKNNNFLE